MNIPSHVYILLSPAGYGSEIPVSGDGGPAVHAKSPHQMQGAVTKTYFAEKMGLDPDSIYNVSIMPCVAKKSEIDIPNINDAGHGKDVDLVLTTREIVRMIRADHLDVKKLQEVPFDSPLGTGTGAGVIFGATGGVMEAALRTCYYMVVGKNPYPDAFYMVRGLDGWKEACLDIQGTTVHVAVVSGLGNTRKLIKALKRARSPTITWRSWPVPAAAPAEAVSPSMTAKSWPVSGAKICISWTAPAICGSPMRTRMCRPSIRKCWTRRSSHKAHELLHTDHHAGRCRTRRKAYCEKSLPVHLDVQEAFFAAFYRPLLTIDLQVS